MKNNRFIIMLFLATILIGQIVFISVPHTKGFALASFTIDPPSYAFQGPGSKDFTVTATLPGGSGTNGVNVYLKPEAGQVSPGIAITYASNPLYIQPNQGSGSTTMTITIDSNAMNGSIPIAVGAYDNPGIGGTIEIGSFYIVLHINQYYLNMTSAFGEPFPAGDWYNEGTQVTFGLTNTLAEDSGIQYNFNGWFSSDIGGYTGADVSHRVTMTNNITETATWVTNLYLVNFEQTGSAIPPIISYEYTAASVTYDATATVPFNVWVDPESTITFSYPDLLAEPGIECKLAGTNTSSPLAVTSPLTILGSYETIYEVSFASSPPNAGYTTPTENVWVNAGSTLAISAAPLAGLHFDHWSCGVSSITFECSTITTVATINGPGTITANFAYDDPTRFIVEAGNLQVAGEPFSVKVTAVDDNGNRIGDYAGTVTFSSSDHAAAANLPADYTFSFTDEGSHIFDGVTLVTGGSQTITATDGLISGETIIMVVANNNGQGAIEISPNQAIVESGITVLFNAEMFDVYGNSLGDITAGISAADGWHISSGAGGRWEGASYTAEVASAVDSPWIVTGTYNGISGTANLIVTHSTEPSKLVSVTLNPSTESIEAGETQIYTATAMDSYGNSWDVTDEISATNSWSITAEANGYWTKNSYTSEKATPVNSPWIVTGMYESVSGTASLTVSPSSARLDRIAISPVTSSITAGGSQSYSVRAFDQYNNDLGEVTSSCTFSVNGAPASGNVVTKNTAGVYTITADYNGKTATATLTVSSTSSSSSTTSTASTASPIVKRYSVTFIQSGLSEGKSWNITFNGVTRSSNTDTIVFSDIASGSFVWVTPGTISGEPDTQYVLPTNNGTISVPSESTFNIIYTTQYYLTVNSTYGNPTGEGWYDANTTASFGVDVQATDSQGVQFGFNGWIGTGNGSYTGSSNLGTVMMTNPVTEAAVWETQSSLYSILLIALIILVIIILALLLVWQRRKRKSETDAADQAFT